MGVSRLRARLDLAMVFLNKAMPGLNAVVRKAAQTLALQSHQLKILLKMVGQREGEGHRRLSFFVISSFGLLAGDIQGPHWKADSISRPRGKGYPGTEW